VAIVSFVIFMSCAVGYLVYTSGDDAGALDVSGHMAGMNRKNIKSAGSIPLSTEERKCPSSRNKHGCCMMSKSCAWTGHGSSGKCGTLRTARAEHWVNQCDSLNKSPPPKPGGMKRQYTSSRHASCLCLLEC